MDVESFAGKLRKSPTESLRKQEGSFGKVSRIHIYRGPVLWIVCTDYGTVTEYVSYVCLTFCGRYRVLTHHESASSATQVVAEDVHASPAVLVYHRLHFRRTQVSCRLSRNTARCFNNFVIIIVTPIGKFVRYTTIDTTRNGLFRFPTTGFPKNSTGDSSSLSRRPEGKCIPQT